MSARLRLGHFRRELRRARRALWSAIRGPRLYVLHPSTADWHRVEPSHPSLLCKCYGGMPAGALADHLPDCLWLAAMCKTCAGCGWCTRCGGDGTEPERGP